MWPAADNHRASCYAFVGADGSVRPKATDCRTSLRTGSQWHPVKNNSCHSEPVTDVTGVRIRTPFFRGRGTFFPLIGAGDEARWRRSRAATRTRAPKCAPGTFFSLRSCPFDPLPAKAKKIRTHIVRPIFLERATRLELASRHPANGDAIRRSPASPHDFMCSAQVEAASFANIQQKAPLFRMVLFLERATRLELATSTLARSRSTR